MIKKILVVALVFSVIITNFNTVNAGLLGDIITQGLNFERKTKEAGTQEYNKKLAQINKEYSEAEEKILKDHNIASEQIISEYNSGLNRAESEYNKKKSERESRFLRDKLSANFGITCIDPPFNVNIVGGPYCQVLKDQSVVVQPQPNFMVLLGEYDRDLKAIKNEYNNKVKKLTTDKEEKQGAADAARDAALAVAREQKNQKLEALENQKNFGTVIGVFIITDVKEAVWAIGNLIFAIITVALGVKFIWSGAEGKAQVLEILPNFVIAVVFFYLADPLVDFVMDVTSGAVNAKNWQQLSGNVIWIINTVVKYLALGGLVYVGIKYLLASAEGKASLKTNMGAVVIGILCVFLASNMVDFIIGVGNEIL